MKMDHSTDFITKFNLPMTFTKVFKEDRVIAGYASVEIVDHQGDMIPISALKEAFGRFAANDFEHALIQFFHTHINIGKAVPEYTDKDGTVYTSHIDDTGMFIVGKIRDDIKKANEAWAGIEKGDLRAFSIGGEALVRVAVCDTQGNCHQNIEKLDLFEISVVDHPANKLCFFDMLKGGKFIKLKNMLDAHPIISIQKGIVIHSDCDCEDEDVKPSDVEYSIQNALFVVDEETGIAKPVPKPKKGEDKDKYISRCISFLENESDRSHKQIQGICFSTWRSSKKHIDQEEIYRVLEDSIDSTYTSADEWSGIQIVNKDMGSTDYSPVYDLVLLRSDYPFQNWTLSSTEGNSDSLALNQSISDGDGDSDKDSNASTNKEQEEKKMAEDKKDETLSKSEDGKETDETNKSVDLEARFAQMGKEFEDLKALLSQIQSALPTKEEKKEEVEEKVEEVEKALSKEDIEAIIEKRLESIVGGEAEDKKSLGGNIDKQEEKKEDENPLTMPLHKLKDFNIAKLVNR